VEFEEEEREEEEDADEDDEDEGDEDEEDEGSPITLSHAASLNSAPWCHFRLRCERLISRSGPGSGGPRQAVRFSYVALVKEAAGDALPARAPPARILRTPVKGNGKVLLDVCAPDRPRRLTVTKARGELVGVGEDVSANADADAYALARKAVWGGLWPRQGGEL